MAPKPVISHSFYHCSIEWTAILRHSPCNSNRSRHLPRSYVCKSERWKENWSIPGFNDDFSVILELSRWRLEINHLEWEIPTCLLHFPSESLQYWRSLICWLHPKIPQKRQTDWPSNLRKPTNPCFYFKNRGNYHHILTSSCPHPYCNSYRSEINSHVPIWWWSSSLYRSICHRNFR